ncbi:flagellar basal-body MS-ring/collar protein FliF [Thalassococcus sp. S3]|uniref:flagellar basal-body MS-ring/collar protein FliF n=1 Tax=Thalassococcus sp. S3 TaxID=2017482 RepID=UPI0010244A45|nr:flagellar basal-body MS-ring/collar protein FliF [Thalassococcus sp. S3]QBF29689.1 flagellar M-ring protein FliF [Thalassococcus sp. S3]
MQQIRTVWAALDNRRRIIIALSTIAVFAGVLALSRMASAPSMTLLYAGLESGAAGDVVRALEQRAAVFDVRGGSIFVDSSQRDELRMTLASEGLPANGGRGYELLDTLNGFGTTSQMFDAAYWRAKEGELARTIVASRHISQARVHIANSGANPFSRSAQPTASVSVTPTGGPLNAAQAEALRHLVASAVAGLAVEDVAIIDANGALLGVAEEANPGPMAKDRAQVLRDRVQRLIEARVGQGNAVVEVSVDTVTERESIRERRFDPESRVAISTDTEERSNTSSDRGGDVTVASNLPDGDAAADGASSAETSESRERVNYEVSETEREIVRAPGAIRRLTVAVLVNGLETNGADGTAGFVERPAGELEALRELVASAVGFDDARGDIITIKSMELPSVAPLGTEANTSLLGNVHLDAMSLIQMAVLAVVTLALALFVIRPILSRPPDLPVAAPAALPPVAPSDPNETTGRSDALTGEIAEAGTDDFTSLPASTQAGEATGDPVARLRNLIGERQEETVEILRSWLEDEEETA